MLELGDLICTATTMQQKYCFHDTTSNSYKVVMKHSAQVVVTGYQTERLPNSRTETTSPIATREEFQMVLLHKCDT